MLRALRRSTVAHAKISGIDTSAAKDAEGVIAVYTGADLAAAGIAPAKPMMPNMNQEMLAPLLAIDVVRFVGEPVAAIVTEELYQGEDAIELVDVDYDPLPAVVDMNDALSAEKGLLFPAGSNVVCTFGDAAGKRPRLVRRGARSSSARSSRTGGSPPPRWNPAPAAAAWGEDGRLTAWIPNQGAQGTKGAIIGMLGLEPENVRIITPDVGGAFGAKFGADAEHAVTCWIAGELGRPTRWSETRMENLLVMPHGRAQQQKITIGGLKDGTVLAYRIEIVQDCGAYPKAGAFLPSLTILMTPGPSAYRGPSPGPHRSSPTPRRLARTGAPDAPRPPPRSIARWTCSPMLPGSTRPRSGGRTCCPSSPNRTRPRSAPSTTRATT